MICLTCSTPTDRARLGLCSLCYGARRRARARGAPVAELEPVYYCEVDGCKDLAPDSDCICDVHRVELLARIPRHPPLRSHGRL